MLLLSKLANAVIVLRHGLGSGCSIHHNKEVMGSNPARCWALFLFSILIVVCP